MTVVSFTVKIDGKQETIEYEDDMPFGVFEKIIKKTADIDEAKNNLLENVQDYRKEIMINALRKAPFEISEQGISKVGYKVVTQIGDKILESYPLGEYLNRMMKPFNDSANAMS